MIKREDEIARKKDKQKSMVITIAIHGVLLVLFAFLLAWKEPNPPLPQYGIEIDMGMDNVGSGDDQDNIEAPESEAEDEPSPVEEAVEDPSEQPVEETSEPTEAVETDDPVDPVDEVSENTDAVPVEPEPKKTTTKTENKTESKEETVTAPIYPGTEKGEGSGASKKSDGDDTDQQGDKGDPESVDERFIYKGTSGGGGGGPQLDITGWTWDRVPDKKDQSAQSGRIKFSFEIDDDGYVVNVTPIESTVSPDVLKFYQNQLEETTFSQTGSLPPKPRTKGTVTFIIKSQ
ncbi:hypothetical protein [Mangrovivirga cuniculi]|uniref:Protein TonB, links inner and outer membranes n=1 Tax=Mangrovivirga cuniculi TaxID=2715131 RepID=A0A4D7JIU0_9BACT|nr:hypothetical protein [Mangrovivirga cuniculi]QCK15511.1 hypothetical protein DCC35_12535 [Mangrovivirga cuniculi]